MLAWREQVPEKWRGIFLATDGQCLWVVRPEDSFLEQQIVDHVVQETFYNIILQTANHLLTHLWVVKKILKGLILN